VFFFIIIVRKKKKNFVLHSLAANRQQKPRQSKKIGFQGEECCIVLRKNGVENTQKEGLQKKGFGFFVFRRRSAAKKEENIFLI